MDSRIKRDGYRLIIRRNGEMALAGWTGLRFR
jgi:hypothetical protein